jgi:RHS repeat-associated protein
VATAYSANNLNQYTQTVVSNQSSVLSYDANGNLTGKNGWTYSYDAQNRLVSASSNGVLIATFAYDPRNRCVIQTIPSTTRYLTYDGWSLIEERDAAGVLQSKYVHGPVIDEIILVTRPSTLDTFYYHHEGLGCTTHLTDNTGSVIESYRYDVFGAPTFFDANGAPQPSSLHSQRFLFTGREWLFEVGLYDYRNRMYSPGLGRFLQTDPIRFNSGDLNFYRYSFNGPSLRVDPLGLTPADLVFKMLGHSIPKAQGITAGAAAGGWSLNFGELKSKYPLLQALASYALGAGTAIMFFPDSCEIGAYSLKAGAAQYIPPSSPNPPGTFVGVYAGYGAGAEYALVMPGGSSFTAGNANAVSFEGTFHTVQGGWPGFPVSGSVFAGNPDKTLGGGRWVGGTATLGGGGGVAYIDWEYGLVTSIGLPKCICYPLIALVK